MDDEIGRDITRALAVDPSPEFLARVRTRIANEPERGLLAALKSCAAFGMWRRISAHRLAIGGAIVAAIVLAVALSRPDRAPAAVSQTALAARPLGGVFAVPHVGSEPRYVGSGFSRTYGAQLVHSSARTVGPPEGGPHLQVLLDPRETQALRALLAGVRGNRVDLSSLLRPGPPAPTALPPVDDLVIAPIAIEPIAPQAGAQGERQ